MLAQSNQFDPARRGYHQVYREHEVNHCPGCGRTHWLIGRLLAECAFCATALPLNAGVDLFDKPETWTRGSGGGRVQ